MEEAYKYLLNDLDLQDGEVVVAGVSGGPDSMALLYLLIKVWRELVRRGKKIQIVCAHVNHKVRKESDEEEIFVKEYSEKYKVIFDCYHIEKYNDDNFHKDARIKRYHYYEELVNKYHARYLFTAHHGDDLMETILMRMTRGSSLRGYSGFSKVVDMGDYKIIRPLINLTKEEIALYDDANNIPYVIDKSNFKDVYTRNRYRKYMLPLLKKEDKNVHHKFYKFSMLLQEYSDYVEKEVKKKMKKIYVDKILNIDLFMKEEHLIQMNILYNLLQEYYNKEIELISDVHVKAIYNLIISNKVNGKVYLPNNIIGRKEYNKFYFVDNELKKDDYVFELSEFVSLLNGKSIKFVDNIDSDSNDVCRLDSGEIKLPLYVRNRKSGDKMSVRGMNGHQKIKDIFVQKKIPASKRDEWPIVFDASGSIIWLPGLKKSKFCKQKSEKYDIILKYC